MKAAKGKIEEAKGSRENLVDVILQVDSYEDFLDDMVQQYMVDVRSLKGLNLPVSSDPEYTNIAADIKNEMKYANGLNKIYYESLKKGKLDFKQFQVEFKILNASLRDGNLLSSGSEHESPQKTNYPQNTPFKPFSTPNTTPTYQHTPVVGNKIQDGMESELDDIDEINREIAELEAEEKRQQQKKVEERQKMENQRVQKNQRETNGIKDAKRNDQPFIPMTLDRSDPPEFGRSSLQTPVFENQRPDSRYHHNDNRLKQRYNDHPVDNYNIPYEEKRRGYKEQEPVVVPVYQKPEEFKKRESEIKQKQEIRSFFGGGVAIGSLVDEKNVEKMDNTRMESLQMMLRNTEIEIEAIEKENQKLGEEGYQVDGKLSGMKNLNNVIRADITDIKEALDEKEQEKSVLNAEITTLESELEALEREIQQTQDEVDRQIDPHIELRTEKAKYRQELQMLDVEIQRYKIGYDSLKKKWDEELKGKETSLHSEFFNRKPSNQDHSDIFNRSSEIIGRPNMDTSYSRAIPDRSSYLHERSPSPNPSQIRSNLLDWRDQPTTNQNTDSYSLGQFKSSSGDRLPVLSSSYADRYLSKDFKKNY